MVIFLKQVLKAIFKNPQYVLIIYEAIKNLVRGEKEDDEY